MAKQEGIIQFTGAIGNLLFFKGKDGSFNVRRKSSIDKNTIANDPHFQRTRDAMAEFSTAAKGGKLLRNALGSLVTKTADKKLSIRLTGTLMKMLNTDTQNRKGSKKLMNSQLNLLKGFEFNPSGPMNSTFKGIYKSQVDRSTGKLSITISEFTPGRDVFKPQEATHFQFHVAALAVDFNTNTTEYSITSSPKINWNDTTVAQQKLECSVQPNTSNHLLLLFAIEFWQLDTSGAYYELMNRNYNTVIIADTSQV